MKSVLGQINLPRTLEGLVLNCVKYFQVVDKELTRVSYRGQLVWDPASIADGDSLTSSDIPTPDARAGDHVKVFPPYTLSGLAVSGYVSAENVSKVILFNGTGGPVDLDEGLWRVMCEKY